MLCVSAGGAAITVVSLHCTDAKRQSEGGSIRGRKEKLLQIMRIIIKPEGSAQCLTADP